MEQSVRQALLALYDTPDPSDRSRAIPGYDRDHAERTTRIVLQVTRDLGLGPSWGPDLEVTCLLHDIGRVGLDPQVFGTVFGVAQEAGLPVRVRDLHARYPHVAESEATAFFLELVTPALRARGIPVNAAVIEHARMRMDFKGRLRQVMAERRGDLASLGVAIRPWMEKVMLYYYYPQDMAGERDEVRLMGMALVACENFEAFNNQRRNRDYYGRPKPCLRDVFTALDRFEKDGLVSATVMVALRRLTAARGLDEVIKESRGMAPEDVLPEEDLAFLRELAA